MPAGAVRVKGLRELNRAFSKLSADLKRELRDELKEAAEPVREHAEELAQSRIRNIGPVWSRMRVGVLTKVVYVAPRARRRGGSPRPNLGTALFERAMQPALDDRQGEVVDRIDGLLGRLADDF